uniref:Lon proteolytic domain-containing protein n=1 Tax=Meloidogyne enterolobii TaxID=390850 RepID=A0A6V7X1M7_MELEN|nr:unnamed protein product [Meloidogyne enterolobii]
MFYLFCNYCYYYCLMIYSFVCCAVLLLTCGKKKYKVNKKQPKQNKQLGKLKIKSKKEGKQLMKKNNYKHQSNNANQEHQKIQKLMPNIEFPESISTYTNNTWSFPNARMLSMVKNIEWTLATAVTQQDSVHSIIGYDEKFFTTLPIGTFTILLGSSDGCRFGYVECADLKNGPNPITVLGNCDQRVKDSCFVARTFTSLFMEEELGLDVYEKQLAINILPAGMWKSGESAGISIVSSMLSCLLKMAPENDYAMIGEISFSGEIIEVPELPVILKAAIRLGVKHLILPKNMEHQWNNINEKEKGGIIAHFVKKYMEVFKMIFPRYQIPMKPVKNEVTY